MFVALYSTMPAKQKKEHFEELSSTDDKNGLTPVQKYYFGKDVFITGVTGFLGKMILEKLLYSCPDVGTCYIMMREKKGQSAEERLDALFKKELFDRLRKEQPGFRKKVVLVYGDLEKPQFGISDDDLETLKNNVAIVLHAAARVNWDDTLRVSATNNIQAIYELFNILHQFRKLEALVHVSTCYVHRDPDLTVPEKIVKKHITPRQLLSTLDWLDDEGAQKIVPYVVTGKNNMYMVTKALAENAVEEVHGGIPTAIVRPTFIAPALREPFPGWGDAFQGPQGLMLAGAKGFLRALCSFKGLKVSIIPADTVVNCIITAAWDIGSRRAKDILVLNCVIDYHKAPLAGKDLLDEVLAKRDKYPLASIYRYPDFTLYYSPVLYHIHAFFDHYIPALFGDAILYIFTGKTLMIRTYRKIALLFGIFRKIGDQPWICKVENYRKLESSLSKRDLEMFPLDADNINWPEYIDQMMFVGRRILGKEDPSNIPYARRKMKIWLYVTTFLKWCIILTFLYYFFTCVSLPRFEPSYERYASGFTLGS